jgi:hypothetical protein
MLSWHDMVHDVARRKSVLHSDIRKSIAAIPHTVVGAQS